MAYKQNGTIFNIGYTMHTIDGVDNDKIMEQCLSRRMLKYDDDPGHTGFEDSILPDTKELDLLYERVYAIIYQIEPALKRIGEWAHILEPNEQTMLHSHNMGINAQLGWCYYVKAEAGCGDFVFQGSAFNRDIMVPVRPATGMLLVFPGWINHMTKKNVSDSVRISIAGNVAVDKDVSVPDSSRIYQYVMRGY